MPPAPVGVLRKSRLHPPPRELLAELELFVSLLASTASSLVLGGICASIFSCHQQAPEWSCAGALVSVPPLREHNVSMSQVLALPLQHRAWGQTPGAGTQPGKDPPGHKIGLCPL